MNTKAGGRRHEAHGHEGGMKPTPVPEKTGAALLRMITPEQSSVDRQSRLFPSPAASAGSSTGVAAVDSHNRPAEHVKAFS